MPRPRDQIRQILTDIEDSGGETHHINALLRHARADGGLPAEFHATLQRFARTLSTNTDAEDAGYIARLRASLDTAERPRAKRPPQTAPPTGTVRLSPGAQAHTLHLIEQAVRMVPSLASLDPAQGQRLLARLEAVQTAMRLEQPVGSAARALSAEADRLTETLTFEAPFARRLDEIHRILDRLATRQQTAAGASGPGTGR